VSKSYVSLAAAIAFAATAPAFATAATAQTAAKPAAGAAQAAPNRTAVLKNLEGSFKALDANGDGTLSQAEIAAAEAKSQQQRVGVLRSRMDAEFTKLDTNKDGQLSKAEFLAAAPQKPAAAPNGANLLAQLDKNKDGKVSPDEYRAPILSRFDKVDANHDGTLSATERQAAQAANTPRKR
jgi:Ca2+-binding EF-hand superfamily protein